MQKVCQQPNYWPNRLTVLLTGQVIPSELAKGGITQLEKKTNPTLCCPTSDENFHGYHTNFSCLFFPTWFLYAFLNTFLFSDVQCGENLFMSTAPFSWPRVVQVWYNEEKDFKHGIGAIRPGAVTGHYTQVDATFLYFSWINKYLCVS